MKRTMLSMGILGLIAAAAPAASEPDPTKPAPEQFVVWSMPNFRSAPRPVKTCANLREVSSVLQKCRELKAAAAHVTVGLEKSDPRDAAAKNYRVYARSRSGKTFVLWGTVVALEDAETIGARLTKAGAEVILVRFYSDK
jgi:hypothetical protein